MPQSHKEGLKTSKLLSYLHFSLSKERGNPDILTMSIFLALLKLLNDSLQWLKKVYNGSSANVVTLLVAGQRIIKNIEHKTLHFIVFNSFFINESINSPIMVKHRMPIIRKVIQKNSHGQTANLTPDQPLSIFLTTLVQMRF